MNTKFWGPSGWTFLHTMSFNYPYKLDLNKKEHVIIRKKYIELFTNFKYTLPCKYCRDSYETFLAKHNVENYLNSRKKITYWLYLIHNEVNKKLYEQETDAVIAHRNKLYNMKLKGDITQNQYNYRLKKQTSHYLFTSPKDVSLEYLNQECMLFKRLQKQQITQIEYENQVTNLKKKILFENASPQYEEICLYYESQRSNCAKKKGELATCRLPN